jgi:hypothetical protein
MNNFLALLGEVIGRRPALIVFGQPEGQQAKASILVVDGRDEAPGELLRLESIPPVQVAELPQGAGA